MVPPGVSPDPSWLVVSGGLDHPSGSGGGTPHLLYPFILLVEPWPGGQAPTLKKTHPTNRSKISKINNNRKQEMMWGSKKKIGSQKANLFQKVAWSGAKMGDRGSQRICEAPEALAVFSAIHKIWKSTVDSPQKKKTDQETPPKIQNDSKCKLGLGTKKNSTQRGRAGAMGGQLHVVWQKLFVVNIRRWDGLTFLEWWFWIRIAPESKRH